MTQFIHVITDAATGEVTEVPFTQAEIEAFILANSPKVPASVSMRQARLALLGAGLLSSVNAAIAAGGEADQITWEYATEVARNSDLVLNLSQALGLTSADLDNLFTTAAAL